MRDWCIDVLYQHVSKEVDISREDYGASLYGWDIAPFWVHGEKVGVVMLRFHEIHMHLPPENAKRYARRLIHEYLEPNLRKHGYLTTISFKDQKAQQFLERIGFYKTGEDENFYSYRIDKIKVH